MLNKETAFALALFFWLRSKLPREVGSINLRIYIFRSDSRNARPDVNNFCIVKYVTRVIRLNNHVLPYYERSIIFIVKTCFICDQSKHVSP